MFIAISSLGGFLLELLASVPISYFLNFGPFLGRHPFLWTRFICSILFPFRLPVGQAFPDKIGQISADDILLRRLIGAVLLVLPTQRTVARELRRLCHAGIAIKQQQHE